MQLLRITRSRPSLLHLLPVLLCPIAHATTLDTLVVEGRTTSLDHSGVFIRIPVEPGTAVDLADLLAGLPGVQVRSSGGLGAYSEASLRGSNGRQVQLLLDGMPLSTGGGEATSLSTISPLLLEQVEIYKGRVPVELDAGLAGSIHLRTPTSLRAPLLGSISAGSFGQRQAHAAAQLSAPFQLTAGTQRADNTFPILNPFKPFDPTDPDRQRQEPRRNADTQQHYASLRYLGAMQINARVLDDHQALPTRDNAADSSATLDTRAYTVSAGLDPATPWRHSAAYHWTEERYRDTRSQIGLGTQDSRSRTTRTQIRTLREASSNSLSLSAEYLDYQAIDALGNLPTASAERLTVDAGAEAASGWGPARLNGSLRVGWSRETADSRSDTTVRFSPAAGLAIPVGACVSRSNLGWRERLPTFFERYGDRGLFKGNPGLQPEGALYGDTGLRCVQGRRLAHVEATLFAQDLRDAISPVYDAQGIGRSVNTARATVVGIELSADGTISGIDWQLGGTWQDSEDRGAIRSARGNQLPGRYTWQANSRLATTWQGITAHYAFRFESGQYYDSANLLPARPLRRHDIGLRGAFRQVGWSLQVLNLDDDTLEQFNGFPTPGRRTVLTLSYPTP